MSETMRSLWVDRIFLVALPKHISSISCRSGVEALFDLFMLRSGSAASRRPAVPLQTPPRRDSNGVGGTLSRVGKFLVSLNYTKHLIF